MVKMALTRRAVISGAVTGLGLVLLLQQFGAIALSLPALVLAVLGGAILAGGAQRLIARRADRKPAVLYRGQDEAGDPSEGDS